MIMRTLQGKIKSQNLNLTIRIVILTATSALPCQKLQIAFNGRADVVTFLGACVVTSPGTCVKWFFCTGISS